MADKVNNDEVQKIPPGVYHRTVGPPLDVSNHSPQRLAEFAEKYGVDLVLDSDSKTTRATISTLVVVPEDKKKKA